MYFNSNRAKTSSSTGMTRTSTLLRMSYYGDEWGGPPFDPRMPPMMMPPPGYGGGGYGRGGGGMMREPGLRELADMAAGGEMNGNVRRGSSQRAGPMGGRGPMGGGQMPPGRGQMGRGGPMPPGIDPFVNPESLRNSNAWGPGGPGSPFGRDNAPARTSLKDMAARTTTSFDAQIINSMNNRPNARAGSALPAAPIEKGGTTSRTTSTASQYVPLNSSSERSPSLNVAPPPPLQRSFIETNVMPVDVPPTVHAARSVRPSVVLVTSKGVGNANSQGSGFVVGFDDSIIDDIDDMKDRCHILTSAHVAPPGWKVSVTFPGDPYKEYPATVVGRKLNSDLALLCVETVADEDEDYPFPPPLVLCSEDVYTSTFPDRDADRAPVSEIGSPVYAFGYPMGVEGPTMTSGIMAATTKGINYMDAPTGEEGTEKSRPFEKTSFVITDAAMAGGMSGGPLVNFDGVVVGVNALVRPDLRALGNYAVSSLECEEFLEKLEDQRSSDSDKSSGKVNGNPVNGNSEGRRKKRSAQPKEEVSDDGGIAGFRVMLYGYSSSKAEASKTLRRIAMLDESRAENAMRSAYSFGAGVVDEFYVAESGDRNRAVKAARKSADTLQEKLKSEGLLVEVEPVHLLK